MPRPRLNVVAPSFTPLPYGLFSALADVTRNPRTFHWEAGVQWESICASSTTTFDPCVSVTGSAGLDVGPAPDKAETASYEQRGATPFTVLAEIDCSAPGFWDRAGVDINRVFTQAEQWQVERALWTGIAAGVPVVYPHLAEDTAVTDGSVVLQTGQNTLNG